jgi:hypothetical protein
VTIAKVTELQNLETSLGFLSLDLKFSSSSSHLATWVEIFGSEVRMLPTSSFLAVAMLFISTFSIVTATPVPCTDVSHSVTSI